MKLNVICNAEDRFSCVRAFLQSKLCKSFNAHNHYFRASKNTNAATRYHAKACNEHAGPLEDACECHALPLLGVKMSRMYEAGVTTGEPAGAIISLMTTTPHGPKTSDIVR